MTAAPRPEGELLHVRVDPRARRDEVVGWRGSALRVRVTAAPHDGLANEAVAGLLARALGVPRTHIVLVRGATTRDKLFRVGRLSRAEVRARVPVAGPEEPARR
ncbi:MAG TPA: DUF167 domain-containing protein [Candidatus Bathyarchaeia archaeon]|nr:DUF167 domain-containing protein [Candidatus Bathyarchaeia archaeon]